jgi:hypothetical protein
VRNISEGGPREELQPRFSVVPDEPGMFVQRNCHYAIVLTENI